MTQWCVYECVHARKGPDVTCTREPYLLVIVQRYDHWNHPNTFEADTFVS